MIYSGNRSERWEWDVLGPDLQPVDVPNRFSGGRLDFNIYADTRASGSVRWTGTPAERPDWLNVRLSPRYVATLADGSRVDWRLGVYLPAVPTLGATGGDVDLFDLSIILRRSEVRESVGMESGTPIIPAVLDLIAEALPGALAQIEDTGPELRTAAVWPPGTSRLRMINDLLESAGYFSLYADFNGTFRSSPYVAPTNRPVEYSFARGEASIFSRSFEITRETFDVPNVVVVISEGSGDIPGMVASKTLDEISPGHPLSIAERGYEVTRTETTDQAASVNVLRQQAERLIRESVSTGGTVVLEHAPLPPALNGRYRFTYPGVGTSNYTMQAVEIDCAPGSLWKSTLREVMA